MPAQEPFAETPLVLGILSQTTENKMLNTSQSLREIACL